MLEQIGDLSLSELSERIRAQNSTVTGIIDRMEREGLVVRERSKEDRRVVHIRLTPKGRKLAEDIPVEPMEIFRGALETLTPERDARAREDPRQGRAACAADASAATRAPRARTARASDT